MRRISRRNGPRSASRSGKSDRPAINETRRSTPPQPQDRAGYEQRTPENGRGSGVNRAQSGPQKEEGEGDDSQEQDQGQGRPGEIQGGRGVVVALIGQRPAVPLVPLVAQPAIDIDMDELSARKLSHGDKIVSLGRCCRLPTIKGQYRDDSRTRAAYSEGAGIYRILPRAVCLPRDEADLISVISWAADSWHPADPPRCR